MAATTTNPPVASDVLLVRNAVSKQLFSSEVANFEHSSLLETHNELYSMFEHTVKDRQGLSVLVIGTRSLGKTAVVNRALQTLSHSYDGQYIVIRLSAYFHTDEHAAVREVARQLDLSVKNDGRQAKFQQPAINDTFSNILNILEQSVSTESMAVIFVVDEIDKFTDNKQTLLYNLLDLAQTSQVPVCVVGVSTKITVRELFEKRVRSRFSQRIITLHKPLSVNQFWHSAKLPLLLSSSDIAELQDSSYGQQWNDYIDDLFANSPVMRRLVHQLFYTTKNYKQFNTYCAHAIALISHEQPFPVDSDFIEYALVQSAGAIQSAFLSLSTLEMLLAIAAARWIEKFNQNVINFNLAYKEYEEMLKTYNLNSSSVSSSSPSRSDTRILTNIKVHQKVWSSKVLRNSWESLYRVGLLIDHAGVSTNSEGLVISTTNLNKTYTVEDSKMVQLDTNLEEIGAMLSEQDPFKRLTKL